ncbi:MAG TPA: TetR/AcrR family transcriptional regulator [Acidimicrobiales bacterium]
MRESSKVRETQPERSARTRSALMTAARTLFAQKGYAETGREEIAETAGVTRGALYHHFSSKADVAEAVIMQIEDELVERVVSAALTGEGVREQLRLGCRAYMEACADPTMARILAEAPSILGVDACHNLEAAACVPLLLHVLTEARSEGLTVPGDPSVAATLLLGMVNAGAAVIAAAPGDGPLRERVSETVDQFLSQILT